MTTRKIGAAVMLGGSVLLLARQSPGSIVFTTTTSGLTSSSCSSTDLLQTNYGSTVSGHETDLGTGPQTAGSAWNQRDAQLRDGTISTDTSNGNQRFVAGNGDFITYAFDTSTNTNGYDITNINTFEEWTDRVSQNYSVLVSFVGSASTFVPLISSQTGGFVTGSQNTINEVSFSNNGGGVLNNGTNAATGVAAIQFNFANAGLGVNMYRELDVIGTATIPEPTSFGILGIGLAGFLARRRSDAAVAPHSVS